MTTVSDAIDVPAGLKGVVVAETALGDVRGREGFYHYRQYSAVELAQQRGLEDVWHLMFEGTLPDPDGRAALAREVAAARHLPGAVRDALPAIAAAGGGATGRAPHGAVAARQRPRAGAGVRRRPPRSDAQDALGLAAAVPTILAALHRLGRAEQPLEPRDDLGHAAAYLCDAHRRGAVAAARAGRGAVPHARPSTTGSTPRPSPPG